MRELRKDPISGAWVIISTERAKRPSEYRVEPDVPRSGLCPFCPGNEGRTPNEVLAYRPTDGPSARPNLPGWSLRVFPNKFPALMIEGSLDPAGDGVYDHINGIGAHEVVVETPDHERQFADLSEAEIERVLHAYRDRVADLRNDRRFRYVMIFKNHGQAAGASVEHSHSQLIALPLVPTTVADELRGALEYWRFRSRCVFCDIVRQELRERARLVHENAEFVVFEPYAARFPFETWIVPRQHRSSFEDIGGAAVPALAQALRFAMRKLRRALDDPPYNFVIHTAPLDERDLPHYHWHLEILPTLSKVAGFELGSGIYINPTPPEEAAQFLRDLDDA